MELSPALQDFITAILSAVLPVLGTLIGGLVALLLVRVYAYLRLRLGEDRFKQLLFAVRFLIQAAEQTGLKTELLQTGAEKKAYVLARLKQEAERIGFTRVPEQTLSDLIEASLREGYHKTWEDNALSSAPVTPIDPGVLDTVSVFPEGSIAVLTRTGEV